MAHLITEAIIKHVARLANLVLTGDQAARFSTQLESVLTFMSGIQKLDTSNVVETSQVTGLENVWREDEVEESRMFTQEEALSSAPATHNGYFVVESVFGEVAE